MLIGFALAWMGGVWLMDWLHCSPLWSAVLLLGAGLPWALRRPWWPWAMVLLLGWSGGMLRMAMVQQPLPAGHIAQFIDQPVQILATIAEEPRWAPDRQQVVLAVQQVRVGQAEEAETASGLLLAYLPPEPPRSLGEQVVMRGTLAVPRSTGSFDYAAYLARRDIHVLLEAPEIEAVQPPPTSPRQWLLRLKQRASTVVAYLLPEPQASLLSGILLGIQSGVAPPVKIAFQRTGTAHILVISGWNISIIVALLLAVGRRLRWPAWPTIGTALVLIVVYVALVGPSAAVVRAALMGAIVACALPLQRRADAWIALAVACWLMTLLNPQTLWDLGFQLSALATASLFAWGKPVEALLRPKLDHPLLRWMLEPLGATLAAQIWTLPLMLSQFGNLSLVAPLANVLMTPVVPLAMAAGAILTCLGLLGRPLGLLALPVTWLALWWLTSVAQWLAAWPWASVQLPWSGTATLVWLLGSGLLWWRVQQRAAARQRTGLAAI